jgi:hypothetical protein
MPVLGTAGAPLALSMDALYTELVRSRRSGHPLTLLLLPGPTRAPGRRNSVRDQALLLAGHVRRYDYVCVLPNHGVVVVAPEAGPDAGGVLALRIRVATGSQPGVSSFPVDGTTVDELLATARRRIAPVGEGSEPRPERRGVLRPLRIRSSQPTLDGPSG